jgi:hypothetical protein
MTWLGAAGLSNDQSRRALHGPVPTLQLSQARHPDMVSSAADSVATL